MTTMPSHDNKQVVSDASGIDEEVQVLRERVESVLLAFAEGHLTQAGAASVLIPAEPVAMYDPVRYVLASGGKRLRPILLLLAARIFGAADDDALPAALAVEVFHNFTLVHDDIMDSANERRGRPSVHVKWDENTAILCGDYLMGLSYALLAQAKPRAGAPCWDAVAAIGHFQDMLGLLCEGQALDEVFEQRTDVSVREYLSMIDRKTGALLQASLEIGGMLGGADETHLKHLRTIGRHAGRAFQIRDDLLDLTAEDIRWGKVKGGDLIEGKRTYILLRAIERTHGADRRWFERIIRGTGLPADQVDEVRERMQRAGVIEEAQDVVRRHTEEALHATLHLPDVSSSATLRGLLQRMQERMH